MSDSSVFAEFQCVPTLDFHDIRHVLAKPGAAQSGARPDCRVALCAEGPGTAASTEAFRRIHDARELAAGSGWICGAALEN